MCACRKANGVKHTLSCCKGEHVIKLHNEIKDITATLLQWVAHSVQTEPTLQTLTGEMLKGRCANTEDADRVDVRCTRFWNAAGIFTRLVIPATGS